MLQQYLENLAQQISGFSSESSTLRLNSRYSPKGPYSASKQRFLTVVSDNHHLCCSKYGDSCEECEPSTSSEPESRKKQVVSMLDLLRPPDSSDLSRKRKINVNKGGQGGNRRSVSRNKKPNYEPQVLAKKRLEESRKKSFKVVSNTFLFCQACICQE